MKKLRLSIAKGLTQGRGVSKEQCHYLSPGLFDSSSELLYYHTMLLHSENAHIRTFPSRGLMWIVTRQGEFRFEAGPRNWGFLFGIGQSVVQAGREVHTPMSVLLISVISCQLENFSNLLSFFSNNAEDYEAGWKAKSFSYFTVMVVKLISHIAQALGKNNLSIEGKLFPNINKMI